MTSCEADDQSGAGRGGGVWPLAASPLLWLAQIAVIYFATPAICRSGRVWVLHAMTGACLVLAGWLLYLAGRRWGRLARLKAAPDDVDRTEEIASRQFAAICGVMSHTFFLSLILASGVPALLVDPCADGPR